MFSTPMPSLQEAVLGQNSTQKTLIQVLMVVLGIALMAASAQFKVPFYPVPVSLQTLGVFIIGASYGWRLAGITMLGYIALGAVGAPVFASATGLYGPTAGFIVGFFLAAVVIGFLAERGFDRNPVTAIIAMFVGSVFVFVPGLIVLNMYFPGKALEFGLYPFVYGELFKMAVAAGLLPALWALLKKN